MSKPTLIASLRVLLLVAMEDFRACADPQSAERVYRSARRIRSQLLDLGAVA